MPQKLTPKINSWDHMKIKTSVQQKNQSVEQTDNPQSWKKNLYLLYFKQKAKIQDLNRIAETKYRGTKTANQQVIR